MIQKDIGRMLEGVSAGWKEIMRVWSDGTREW
jgi:hypothetical protein